MFCNHARLWKHKLKLGVHNILKRNSRNITSPTAMQTTYWRAAHHLIMFLFFYPAFHGYEVKVKAMAEAPTDIFIGTDHHLGVVSEKFLSLAIDTSAIHYLNILKLLGNYSFMTMLNALKPAFLRVGGNAADRLIFDEYCHPAKNQEIDCSDFVRPKSNNHHTYSRTKNTPYPLLCLSGERWLLINKLVNISGFSMLFDLNALIRSQYGDWDSKNAEKILNFSQRHELLIDWQLGNEPNSFFHKFGVTVSAQQLAQDFRSLFHLLSKYSLYHSSNLVGPDITAPRKITKLTLEPLVYLDQFLSHVKNVTTATTWHHYYMNGRNASKEDFTDSSILDMLALGIKAVKSVVKKHMSTNFPVWISETSSAWGGGAPGLSDRFLSGFMWMDKLGLAAKFNISVVVRQTLIGRNHYSLIDLKTLKPNPDFWISILYKKIVGRYSLSLVMKPKHANIRLYAHCATEQLQKSSNDTIVIFGVNLGRLHFKGSLQSSKPLFMDLYELTSPKNDILSKSILLNRKPLSLTSSGNIPELNSWKIKSKFLKLPPFSLSFYIVHGIKAPACACP